MALLLLQGLVGLRCEEDVPRVNYCSFHYDEGGVMKKLAYVVLFLAVILICAQAYAIQISSPIVDSAWLEANMDDVVILEVGKAFDEDHIPGAIFVNFSKVRASREVDGYPMIKLLPLPEEFEALMQASGVNKDSAIVITNRGTHFDEVTMGTRLYWTLKYYGHKNMALLDGGNAQWVAEERPVSNAPSAPGVGNYKTNGQHKSILATTDDVLDAVGDDDVQIVDVRDLQFYLGMVRKKSYIYADGTIEGARHLPPNLLIDYHAPYVFMDAGLIAQAMQAIGIDPYKETIGTCNSAHQASGLWFILHEVIGNKKMKLHDESLHGWTMRGLPTVTMEFAGMDDD